LEKPGVIIDVVLISYELNVLEARFYELNTVVDYFVIVESVYTHRGWMKPRFEKRDNSRFSHFLDEIIYLGADEYPEHMNAVLQERQGAVLVVRARMFGPFKRLRHSPIRGGRPYVPTKHFVPYQANHQLF
jgi:hypothetical protein